MQNWGKNKHFVGLKQKVTNYIPENLKNISGIIYEKLYTYIIYIILMITQTQPSVLVTETHMNNFEVKDTDVTF